MFDQYRAYSQMAEQAFSDSKGQIFDDIAELKKITEFYDLIDFVNLRFGNICNATDNCIKKDYPENRRLLIKKEDNIIAIIAVDEDKKQVLLSRYWKFTPIEDAKSDK